MSGETVGQKLAVVLLVVGGAAAGFYIYQKVTAKTPMADVALKPRDLPGITVSIPDGVVSGELDRYELGSLRVVNPADRAGIFQFTWELGEMPSGEQMAASMDGMIDDMELDSQWSSTIGGLAVDNLMYHGENGDMLFSLYACGNRSFGLISMIQASKDDIRTMHERIIGGFACQNDDSFTGRQPAPAFDPPPGFGYVPASDPITFAGLDDSAFMFVFTSSEIDHDAYPEFMKRLMATEGVQFDVAPKADQAVTPAGDTRPIYSVSVVEEGEAGDALMTAWYCTDSKMGFMAMYFAPDGHPMEVGRQGLLTARCPGPNSSVDDYPTADAVFQAACDAGDTRGCATE